MTTEVLSFAQLFAQRLDLLLVIVVLVGVYFIGKKVVVVIGKLVDENLSKIDSNITSLTDALHALREEMSVLNKNLALDEHRIDVLEQKVEKIEDKLNG